MEEICVKWLKWELFKSSFRCINFLYTLTLNLKNEIPENIVYGHFVIVIIVVIVIVVDVIGGNCYVNIFVCKADSK